MSYRLSNYEHVPHNIVEQRHIENLLKLREYLLGLPEGYEHFDMQSYARIEGSSASLYRIMMENAIEGSNFLEQCGAVACAVGHTFAAGVARLDKIPHSWTWSTLTRDAYGIDYGTKTDHAWTWCFESTWATVDNTPQGAGHRIGYMLQHNIPIGENGLVVFSPAIYQPV